MFLAACCRPSREEGVPLQGSIQGRAWGGSRCSERRRRGCWGRPSTWQSTIFLCYHPVGRPTTQYLTPTTSRSSQSSPTCHRESSELSANAIAHWGSGKLLSNAIAIQLYGSKGASEIDSPANVVNRFFATYLNLVSSTVLKRVGCCRLRTVAPPTEATALLRGWQSLVRDQRHQRKYDVWSFWLVRLHQVVLILNFINHHCFSTHKVDQTSEYDNLLKSSNLWRN